MKNITLDTNAYSGLSQGILSVKQAVEGADTVYVPVFVFAELLFGFKKGGREHENIAMFNDFMKLQGISFHFPTEETARIYSEIILDLKQKGRPIPTHDIWIAASAIETGSVIVTYDKHFLNFSQVRVWDVLQF